MTEESQSAAFSRIDPFIFFLLQKILVILMHFYIILVSTAGLHSTISLMISVIIEEMFVLRLLLFISFQWRSFHSSCRVFSARLVNWSNGRSVNMLTRERRLQNNNEGHTPWVCPLSIFFYKKAARAVSQYMGLVTSFRPSIRILGLSRSYCVRKRHENFF